MYTKTMNEVFINFVKNPSFQLPIEQKKDQCYIQRLEQIYKEYLVSLEDFCIEDKELKKSANDLCNLIIKIFKGTNKKQQYKDMDEIIKSLVDSASPTDLLSYRKKSVKPLIGNELFHNKDKTSDLLKLYRATDRVGDVKAEKSIEEKIKQLFHCPYNRLENVSSTRFSMKGIPSLYLSTSIELPLREIGVSESTDGKEAFISQFKINRDISSSVSEIQVLEFGIVPSDFINPQVEYEEEKDKEIYATRLFQKDLLEKECVRKAYLLWYPLFCACSFIKKNKKKFNDPIQEEYIIPQLFLTRLNEKSIKSNTLYGIRYFSCSTKESYLDGFNYVFPVGESIKTTKKLFSTKLLDSFQITDPIQVKNTKIKDFKEIKDELQRRTFYSISSK